MGSFLQKLKKQTLPHCSVVVVAAGSARRMAGVDKIMAPIAGQPVIARTLTVFQTCSMVDEVVVVTRSDLIVPIGNLCKDAGLSKVTKIVAGGADRSHSVLNGLKEISNRAKLIAIHDGARPFVSQQVLESVIRMAAKTGAAAPAVPVTDTIKIAENGVVTATPDRETLFAVQTPQVFDADLIRGALHHCLEQELALTDDCSAVEQLGKLVSLTEGDTQNIKITTQFDLLIGEAIASCQSVT
jgi:2-C-methyl-D-erythritol 4-phosphate cytidylyltransferase